MSSEQVRQAKEGEQKKRCVTGWVNNVDIWSTRPQGVLGNSVVEEEFSNFPVCGTHPEGLLKHQLLGPTP